MLKTKKLININGGYTIDLDIPQKTKSEIKNKVKSMLNDIFDELLPTVNPVVQTSWSKEEPEYSGDEELIISIKKNKINDCITKWSAIQYFMYVENGTLDLQLNYIARNFVSIYGKLHPEDIEKSKK